jgi:hypothetical protein
LAAFWTIMHQLWYCLSSIHAGPQWDCRLAYAPGGG